MPFFNKTSNIEIKHGGIEVAVIATFNTMGKIKPLYFSVHDAQTDENYKIEISNINSQQESYDYITYNSAYINAGQKRECILKYSIREHRWILTKY